MNSSHGLRERGSIVTSGFDISELSEFQKKVEERREAKLSAEGHRLADAETTKRLGDFGQSDNIERKGDLSRDAAVRFYLRVLKDELSEEGVTEIAFNHPASHTIFVEKNGCWEERPFRVSPRACDRGVRRFSESEPVLPERVQTQANFDFINSLSIAVAQYNGADIKESSPILSAAFPDGERVQFVRSPACPKDGISMSVRRPSLEVKLPQWYLENGFFDEVNPVNRKRAGKEELLALYERFFDERLAKEEIRSIRLEFLRRAVELGRTIVIAGATGSGKTTFMKALMQFIPSSERIITIEDCPELVYGLPNHRNQVNLLYPSEATEESPVNATKLVKSCLRMKPDRILLAELRGGETYDWVSSVLSGHAGSITSCHAANAAAVFDYLSMKIKESPVGRNLPHTAELLRSVIDVIVHIQNDKGERFITEVYFREYEEEKNGRRDTGTPVT